MHPAYSVIFFTTAAGAGYGLLALLGLTAAFGFEEPTLPFRLVSVGLALALIVSGLLSSTAHLGRPERAWRALSQWRTSWLSREGVAALATFVPAGIFAIGWVVLGLENWWVAAAGILAAFGSVVTICTTAMIYASLKPIPRWSSRYTLPNYLVLSAMTGAVLFDALLATFEQARASVAILAAVLALGGWALKRATWRYNDALGPATTLNSATGLAGGTVRSIEWPHTAENYLLKEMGYAIARKHALKLRLIAQALAFVVPVILLVAGLAAPAWAAAALSVLAAISQLSGVLVERWLFFAEAKHAVALYYGR